MPPLLSHPSRPSPTPRARPLLIIATLGLLLPVGLRGQTASPPGRVADARPTLEKWVETRRLISHEKRDLALNRETLKEQIGIIEREIQAVTTRIEEARKNASEADQKRAALQADVDKLKAGEAVLLESLLKFEQKARELMPKLPAPLAETLAPLAQRLPAAGAETKLSLGERYLNVVGILNQVDKFNGEITVKTEIRSLRDGTSAEVTVVYVGIGQAYYASANGKTAGIGSPGPAGWTWSPADEVATDIVRAIAILKNEQPADFVRLPIKVQ